MSLPTIPAPTSAALPGLRRLPMLGAQADDALYRRYFLSAIAIVLTVGATWGAWMLYRIGIAHDFKSASIFQINSHGHAQIAGWVGLFIMGFAYQAFPQKWHTSLYMPRLAPLIFVAMLSGLIIKTVGLASPDSSWGAITALVGGIAETLAAGAFAWQMMQTFRKSITRFDPWIGFVMTALAFFVMQAAFDTWHSWTTMSASSMTDLLWYVATYQAPLRDLQLHGMALLMILGVCQRLLPAFFKLPPISKRRAWTALALIAIGTLLEAGIFIAYRWMGNHVIAAFLMIPWIMLCIGCAMIALPWKLWRPIVDQQGQPDRVTKFIRTAYLWLLISLLMLLALPAYSRALGAPFSHAYYGAIRHAFTVGFISLMIMGFAAKVVPVFNHVNPRTLSTLWGPFILINVGCTVRVTLQILTDWQPRAFSYVGISGVLEVTALAWWGLGLVTIIWQGIRRERLERLAGETCPL